MDHQRDILRLAFAFDENGRLPWDTILYSCVKKSGKNDGTGLNRWPPFLFHREPADLSHDLKTLSRASGMGIAS